ncbi:MAG: radical SAM protein [Bdellovibrio sp.]|nr:radical SAM protein [Bdellovibrio sp.]
MFDFPINYEAPVFRPPSEANSLLIQVTLGCSHNQCTYCGMYRTKKFQIRPIAQIKRDLEMAKSYFERYHISPAKIFFCDGDALAAPTDFLLECLHSVHAHFPNLQRVGIYATAMNILQKSDSELQSLSTLKLNMAYLGLESGHDEILKMVVKGNSAQEMIEASLKIKRCGWKLSTILMIGLGGKEMSGEHCLSSAEIVNKTSPNFFSYLVTTPVPGTPYHTMISRGKPLTMLNEREELWEMRTILEHISEQQQNAIIFRANHVSNRVPFAGTLPRDRARLVAEIDDLLPLASTRQKNPSSTIPCL